MSSMHARCQHGQIINRLQEMKKKKKKQKGYNPPAGHSHP